MYKFIILGAAALFSTACWADGMCEAVGKQVATSDKSNWPGEIPYRSCKAMPDNPNLLIMVMDDKVHIVDAQAAKIVSSGDLGAMPDRVDRFVIDTGRYRLAPKTRAFGIRFAGYHPHYYAGEQYESMNLFVVEGKHIRAVMQSLQTNFDVGGTECVDDNDESTCVTHNSSERSDIAISKSVHRGYADLIVTKFSSGCDDEVEKGSCDKFDPNKSPTIKDKVTTLTFDGKQYTVPDELRGE
jgi:hypothetical protein